MPLAGPAHLYEIPITLPVRPSRKPMVRMASPALGNRRARDRSCADQEQTMLDILMLVLAAGFFALAIGYTYACERL